MKLTDVYKEVGRLLKTADLDPPKPVALRQIRSGLDARAPGWRDVAAADPDLLKLLIVVRGPGAAELELILWMRSEGDQR